MYFRINIFLVLLLAGGQLMASDEFVVTPSRNSQSLADVIPSIIVIDRAEIDSTPAADIADLLRWYAGIDIGRTGGIGQPASVFIRGSNSNHTAVLINGVKMNSATTGAPALEVIDTSTIERIEVVKGPRSTIYGSDTLGGVINIITKTDPQETSAKIHFSNGRYSTNEQGFDVKYVNQYLNADFAFNRLHSDGFPTVTNSATDHGHESDTVDLNFQTELGKAGINLGYWEVDSNTEYDGFGTDLDQDRKNSVFHSTVTIPFADNWNSTFSISKAKDEIRQNQTNFLGEEDFALTDRTVYEWKNDISVLNNTLSVGAAMIDEDATSLSFGTRYKENTHEYSLFLNQQFDVGKHSFFGSSRYVDHDDFGDELLWNADYAYRISNQMRVFASFGTGFRAPDSNARFGFGGNPDLKEERSRSIEAGVNYNFSDTSDISLRVYENKFEDLIETILIDPGTFTFENRNVSDARVQGLEIAYRHQSKHWDVGFEGSIKDPVNETDDTQLLRRAKRSLHGSLAYKNEKYFLQLNGLLTSERADFGDVEIAGYGLLNLSAGLYFPYATLTVKVENLLDKEYELASGFNTPGQSVFTELSINFTE